MALSFDSSPLRDFVTGIAGAATPAEWAWKAGLLAVALAMGWLAARAFQRAVASSPRWRSAASGFERVAFPLVALALVWAGKAVMRRYFSVAVLDIAQSLLLAMVLIRFAEHVLGHVLPSGNALRQVLRAIAWTAWILVALYVTGLLPQVADALEEVGFSVGKSEITLLDLAKGFVAIVATVALALWLSRVTEGRLMAAESMEMTTRVVIAKVVRIAALFLAVFIALPLAGIDVTALSVFSGALGVGLGFGLQKIASNYVSGFIVLLDRGLRIGDVVTVDGRRGEVKAIESRFTVIKGGDGVESIIPNEKLITEIVNHHTYSDSRISLVLTMWISYDSDLEAACATLLEAAKRQPRVIADPPSTARIKQLGELGIELELTVWIADPVAGEGELKSDLLKDILRGFRASGIEIPRPRRDVRLVATPETPEKPIPPRG